MRANPQVSDLRLDDAHLEELNRNFVALRTKFNINTRVFTETQPVRLPWWLGGRFLSGVTVVSPTSSEAHIPGEVGIPIEANHITICKPKDRNAGIHRSLIALIKEVEASASLPQRTTVSSTVPPSPEHFEAMLPEDKVSKVVHLAFAMFGATLNGNTNEPICASICLVTDAPDRLKRQLEQIRMTIQDDPLINAAAKKLSRKAALAELAQSPGARTVVLRELAVTWFSVYLYYCPKEAFNVLTHDARLQKFFVVPLFHRLSKKGEHLEQVHTQLTEISRAVDLAINRVQTAYARTPHIPKASTGKYSLLEELASLIATASCRHLANPSDDDATELFETFRTRIRYAENIVTGEKHTRDVNPLP